MWETNCIASPPCEASPRPHVPRVAVSAASLRARISRGVLPARRTDSHSRLCAATPTRRTCASAPKSTFWPLTSRREALAVSSGAPHARTARWDYPAHRTDSRRRGVLTRAHRAPSRSTWHVKYGANFRNTHRKRRHRALLGNSRAVSTGIACDPRNEILTFTETPMHFPQNFRELTKHA